MHSRSRCAILCEQVQSSIAGSFRCDASMDRNQKDKKFLLLKTINNFGQGKTVFIGLGNVSERGAVGHLSSLKEGAKDTTGFDNLLKVSNHMSTDGENKNVGAHKDLWKLIDDERT